MDKKETNNEKMSYEQVSNIAHQLSNQVNELYRKLQAANLNNMFKRLDYLFKVVENSHVFSPDFTDACIKEIEEMMTIPQESSTKNEEKESEHISEADV